VSSSSLSSSAAADSDLKQRLANHVFVIKKPQPLKCVLKTANITFLSLRMDA
jgi:hypothetical protein